MRYAKWIIKPHDPDRVRELSRAAAVSPLLAQVLIARGIAAPEDSAAFFDTRLGALHEPESLPGVVAAADRICSAVRERRKIVIYGDYDVDGVCGTSLLWACLRLAGAAPDKLAYYLPHRVEEGYGLNAEALRKIKTELGGELVVTVDCGITATAEAELARELGLELIITDHHAFGPELPQADVLVHPRLPQGGYPFGELCGCGVAFKLAWRIAKSFGDGKRASPRMRDFLVESVALTALATIADVVPLVGENRLLVHHGLLGLKKKPTAGMKALLEAAKCSDRSKLGAGTVGFQLAPRLNAAGRLETAARAVELLTTADESLAREIARELDERNLERRRVEAAMVQEAKEAASRNGAPWERSSVVVAKEGWHAGVIGIAAGRLAETYHRPAIVATIHDGKAQASGRSIPGFDLHKAIAACSDHLDAFGGHSAAAGLRLPADRVEAFSAAFEAYCRQTITSEQKTSALAIDAEIEPAMLTPRAVEELEKLEPHGLGNPRPVFASADVELAAEPKLVGADGSHVQLRLRRGDAELRAIAWRMAEPIQKAGLAKGSRCAIAYHASVEEWNQRREIKLEIRDFKPLGAD